MEKGPRTIPSIGEVQEEESQGTEGFPRDDSSNVSILRFLANGIDPISRKSLPKDHVCNHVDVVRALWSCLHKLETVESKSSVHPDHSCHVSSSNQEPKHANRGKGWNEDDDQYLTENYQPSSVAELAKHFKRSELAIVCRAISKGLEKDGSETAIRYGVPEKGFKKRKEH